MQAKSTIQLTVFTSDNGPLNKTFTLDPSGQIHKQSNAFLSSGQAKTLELESLGDFAKLVNSLQTNQCIATGIFDKPEVAITSKPDATDAYRRNKENMYQPELGLLLLDYDIDDSMPQALRFDTPNQFIKCLQKNVPELANIAMLGTVSSSGLVQKDSLMASPLQAGFHIYFVTAISELTSIKRLLEVRLWNAGFGYIKLAANGAMLPRTILDLSVMSPERLIFEASPDVGKGLKLRERAWQYQQGDHLLDLPDLTKTDIAEYEKRKKTAMNDAELTSRAKEKRAAYLDKLADLMVEKSGGNKDEIKAQLQARLMNDISFETLQVEDIIDTGNEMLTVADLLARHEEFDGKALPDPIEGREYGKTTAIFYYNQGDKPLIKSFAHGQDTYYRLYMQQHAVHKISPEFSKTVPLDKFPDVSEKESKPIVHKTIDNISVMLEYYGIKCSYNEITKRVDITFPSKLKSSDNEHAIKMSIIRSLAVFNQLNSASLNEFIDVIAGQNSFNPVKEAIETVTWDGQDRLPSFYATLTVADGFSVELRDKLIYRWLMSIIACLFLNKGFHSRGVLVLQGDQSIGKTGFFKRLLPAKLARYIKCDLHLDPRNKDSVLIAISHLIVEIGELDSSFKKDIARLKAFISSAKDDVRPPYGQHYHEYQRRTVFCASVNHSNFLVDETGNTRWWTIPVIAIDYQHDIDMLQLFAQLHNDFITNRPQWYLTQEEEQALNASNLNFRAVSSIRDTVFAELDWEAADSKWSNKTATQVLKDLGYEKPTNQQARECGSTLREKLGESKKSGGNRVWRCPPVKGGMQ